MPETELLIRKAETLPNALFEEAVHYIDYLSQKHSPLILQKNWLKLNTKRINLMLLAAWDLPKYL